MMFGVLFVFLLVCIYTGLSKSTVDEERKVFDVHDDRDSLKGQTSPISSDVEPRFFDLGRVINQLFPGFNQGGAGGSPGLNLPSNSQFYPGHISAQIRNYHWNGPHKWNGRYSNHHHIRRPLFQNQGTSSDINFNQQGSINNINQPGQYLNRGGLGQYPGNLNGNLINGGGNQRRQPGSLENSDFQSGPSQLGGQRGQGRPNYDINAFEYPGRQPANSDQGASNFGNNPQNQYSQSNLNRYPSQGRNPNVQGQDQEPQNPTNNYDQRQPNQNGQQTSNLEVSGNQYKQGANNRGQNNFSPQGNENNNFPTNVNQGATDYNQNTQGVQLNPGQSSGNSFETTYPDDDYGDFGLTSSKITPSVTSTTPPTTKSPLNGNAIRGKPVIIPTSSVSPDQVFFVNSEVPTASQKECVQNCPTSSEYDPICGTDNVTYFNPGRLLCARNCGISVFESRKGSCDRDK